MLDVLERTGQSRLPAFNEVAAERLREAATLLAHQGDNPYRVGAYRRAADAVAAQTADLRELLDIGGIKALEEIQGVGSRIAGGLAELARTGRWTYLEQLRGSAEPRDVFCAIPGVRADPGQAPARDASRGDARATGSGLAREERKHCRGNWSAPAGNPARRAGANAGAHPPRSHRAYRRTGGRLCCLMSIVNTARKWRQTN